MYFRNIFEMSVPILFGGALRPPGWTDVDAEVFIARCRASMRDPSIHSYATYYFWLGQKPS